MIESAGRLDKDVAREARLAGELCIEKGELDRAQNALELSRSQYERMEREDEAAIVHDLITVTEEQLSV